MTNKTAKNLRKALFAIAEGFPVEAREDRYIIVDNPEHREELGTDPFLVIDVLKLYGYEE